jgi:hypothetical protein
MKAKKNLVISNFYLAHCLRWSKRPFTKVVICIENILLKISRSAYSSKTTRNFKIPQLQNSFELILTSSTEGKIT